MTNKSVGVTFLFPHKAGEVSLQGDYKGNCLSSRALQQNTDVQPPQNQSDSYKAPLITSSLSSFRA